jgi:hypothetical protein
MPKAIKADLEMYGWRVRQFVGNCLTAEKRVPKRACVGIESWETGDREWFVSECESLDRLTKKLGLSDQAATTILREMERGYHFTTPPSELIARRTPDSTPVYSKKKIGVKKR